MWAGEGSVAEWASHSSLDTDTSTWTAPSHPACPPPGRQQLPRAFSGRLWTPGPQGQPSPTQAHCFCGLSHVPGQQPAPTHPPHRACPGGLWVTGVRVSGHLVQPGPKPCSKVLCRDEKGPGLRKAASLVLEIKSPSHIKGTDKAFRRKWDKALKHPTYMQVCVQVCFMNTETCVKTQVRSWALLALGSGASGEEPACQCWRHKRHRFDPWVGKGPWRRAWQPTPVFLSGESHGQRRVAGYSPWGHKESDTTEEI